MTSQGPRSGDRERRYTRRHVVASLGAGALVGVGAVGTASGSTVIDLEEWADRAPWDVQIDGIADGRVLSNHAETDTPDESTSVSFDGETVRIFVSVRRTDVDCYELFPRRVRTEGDRLGIALDLATGEAATACPEGERIHYQIELTPTDPVDTVVVGEQFTDVTRSEPGRTRFDREPRVTLPDGVADYEVILDDGSVDPTDDPAISVDGSTVTVEGAVVYGSSSCNTIRLTEIDRADDRLDVAVGAALEPLYVPGQPCTADMARSNYTLRIELTDAAEFTSVTVAESDFEETRTATATLDSASDPIVDWTLETGVDDVPVEQHTADPQVVFDGREVIVEGAIDIEECLELTDSIGVDDSHLEVVVSRVSIPDCEVGTFEPHIAPYPMPYRLTIQTRSVETVDRVTAIEMGGRNVGDIKETTVRRPGTLDPIDGAMPTDPDGDGVYEDLTGDGTVGFTDVNTLFQHTDSPAVTDHPDAYDVTGDGEVDLQDVLAIFESV